MANVNGCLGLSQALGIHVLLSLDGPVGIHSCGNGALAEWSTEM